MVKIRSVYTYLIRNFSRPIVVLLAGDITVTKINMAQSIILSRSPFIRIYVFHYYETHKQMC
jgi:hypothetical protein